jgi:amino acid permease
MEGLAMICLEASNPRVTMKTAVRAIFYRIVLLCMLHSFDANVVLTQTCNFRRLCHPAHGHVPCP